MVMVGPSVSQVKLTGFGHSFLVVRDKIAKEEIRRRAKVSILISSMDNRLLMILIYHVCNADLCVAKSQIRERIQFTAFGIEKVTFNYLKNGHHHKIKVIFSLSFKQYHYLQLQMEEAEPNNPTIQEEQKEQDMQPQTQRVDQNQASRNQPQPQPIIDENMEQSMQEEKQNQSDEQIQNEEDLVDQEVEDRDEANLQENANNVVEQEYPQVEEQKEEEPQKQPSIQREVQNQIEAEVEEKMQNAKQQQPQQQEIQNESQEGYVQEAAQQNQPNIISNEQIQPVFAQKKQPYIPEQQKVENIPDQRRNGQTLVDNIQQQMEKENENAKKYIHQLQRQLQSMSTENNALKRDMNTLRQAQLKLRQDFETNKQTVLDLRKKKLEAEFEKTKALKECDKIKKQNELHRKKIEEVQKIGDIIELKNTLQELKVLTQVQKQEIQQLKSSKSQPLLEELKERILMLQEYQKTQREQENQIQRITAENKMLLQQLNNTNNLLTSERNQVEKLKQRQAQLQKQNLSLSNTIRDWQNKWLEFQSERQSTTRARDLQKKIFDYESQKNIGYENELIHLNVLSDREEKDIILREYLILEGKYKQQQFEMEEAKMKLRKLQREQSRVYTNYIRKKEYIDLSVKYNKAKKCLEGAFQQLRLIKNDESQPQNVQDEVNELLEGVEAKQCQKLIKNTHSIVTALHDKIDSLEQSQNITTSKREHEHLQQTIKLLSNQQAHNQKLLKLMTDDITLKNRLIAQKNQIINTLRKRTLMMPTQTQNYKTTLRLSNQVASLKQTVSVFETQNILLVKQISSLNAQLAHWKHLYNTIKDSLKQKISISLQHKNTNGTIKVVGQEPVGFCKECQQRKLFLSSKELESIETQTDNLTQFYYKEIKQILAFLNKVAKECEKVPQLSRELNHSISEIKEKFASEFKEKYLRVQSHYNGKLNELKREKADNESWRVRAKEEIREEFQDIRDLVINNRLVNALRQAKNLIDYLEAQVQKQDEQNPQEEMQEQNPAQLKKDE